MEGFALFVVLIVVALVVWIILSCIKIVPQAHSYVIERLGTYQDTWSVGMHFKAPFITHTRKFKLEPKTYEVTFSVGNDGAITKDMQTVGATVAVRYVYDESRLKDIVTLYANGTVIESAMRDNVKASLKETTGKYSIYDLVAQQNEITSEVANAMLTRMSNYPIAINQTTITNWDWSEDFDRQIKETANRTQQVKQAEQEANIAAAQAQKKVKEAEANKQAAELDAQAAVAKAEGESKAKKIRADADAYEAKQIAANQQAYQKQWDYEIALEKAKRWNGKEVPDAAYIVPGTGAVVPLSVK